MFFTYLRRELRGRMRQAILIASGLAVGIGLVITVTALSAGVRNAQGTVLHRLYGVGTDVTVTRAPAARAGGPRSFGFGGATGTRTRPAAGTKIDIDTLSNFGLGTLSSSSVTAISRLHNVSWSRWRADPDRHQDHRENPGDQHRRRRLRRWRRWRRWRQVPRRFHPQVVHRFRR